MTFYGQEVLETIQNDATQNEQISRRNLARTQNILDVKRDRLGVVNRQLPEYRRVKSTAQGKYDDAVIRIQKLHDEKASWISSRKDFEIAMAATVWCFPCIIGFKAKIDHISGKINDINGRLNNAYQSKALNLRLKNKYSSYLLKWSEEKASLEKEILEVDGLKNRYSKANDNLKALMQYASNIKTNAADVSRLIGECGDNIDECYTIIPIRTAIDKLKREGKGFWDYLKKIHWILCQLDLIFKMAKMAKIVTILILIRPK